MISKPKTVRKVALIAFWGLLFLISNLARPTSSSAQFLGYVTPQTVTQVLASGTNCTGSAQIFVVANLGQTQHYAYILATTTVQTLTAEIDGIDKGGDTFRISDQLMQAGATQTLSSVQASGYFPTVQVKVTCQPVSATFTLNYSGASATTNVNSGTYQLGQSDKIFLSGFPLNTTISNILFQAPFLNSSGLLIANYSGGTVAGSTVNISCNGNTSSSAISSTFTFALANSASIQTFPIPASLCPMGQVTYTTGGAGAGTVAVEYVFYPPGATGTNAYTHITGTTATTVKAGPGVVHSLVVGTSAAGTISLFDLVSSSCTGTPATNIVAVITEFASAAPPPPAYLFDALFNNGICAKASAAMDFTVISQ